MHTADTTATAQPGELCWEFIYLFVLYPSLATHQHIYTHLHTYNTHLHIQQYNTPSPRLHKHVLLAGSPIPPYIYRPSQSDPSLLFLSSIHRSYSMGEMFLEKLGGPFFIR